MSAAVFAKHRIRALLVDDNPADIKVEKAILDTLGMASVDTAENGSAARFKIMNTIKAKAPYGLIVTDWRMPELSGLELLKVLRAEPMYEKTPIIMMTGVAEQEKVMAALEAGASDYILKPVARAVLAQKLMKFWSPIV